MKIILLHRGEDGLRLVLEDIIDDEKIFEFIYATKSEPVLNSKTIIKLFKYLYDIDTNEYNVRDIISNSGSDVISLYLKNSDYTRIIRDRKLNVLLDI